MDIVDFADDWLRLEPRWSERRHGERRRVEQFAVDPERPTVRLGQVHVPTGQRRARHRQCARTQR